MANSELLTAADVRLMQGLAQRIAARRLDLVNGGAMFGELAWNWGKDHAAEGANWPCRLWFSGGDLVAWGWACLPHQVRLSDGSTKNVAEASLTYQVHPEHAALVDELIDWFDATTPDLDRTVTACAGDEFALGRWAARGYGPDLEALGHNGTWTQLNERDLTDLEVPVLPNGFRFRTAEQVGPQAAVKAHVDAWAPSKYSAEAYEGVRQTSGYRGDLHVLVEAPDGSMASSTIMWLDEANKSAEFEPFGTHPDHRRLRLGHALVLHGLRQARAAGAVHATVACKGAPGRPAARGLYYGAGFRALSRDAPLIKTKGA